jgi:hypothetical protein
MFEASIRQIIREISREENSLPKNSLPVTAAATNQQIICN